VSESLSLFLSKVASKFPMSADSSRVLAPSWRLGGQQLWSALRSSHFAVASAQAKALAHCVGHFLIRPQARMAACVNLFFSIQLDSLELSSSKLASSSFTGELSASSLPV